MKLKRLLMGTRRTLTLALAITLGTAGFAGCGKDDKPSASEWRADVVKICNRVISERGPTGEATGAVEGTVPTADQLLAFYAAYTPKVSAAVKEIEALKRPSGLDAKIDEFEAALDSVALSMKAIDRADVEAEIATGNNTGDYARFEAANTAAGVPECSQ